MMHLDVAPAAALPTAAPRNVSFEVIGIPAPQGSKRFVGRSKSGRGILVESSAKVRPWRQDVAAAASSVRANLGCFEGPLVVHMVFTLPKPKSAPKRRRTWPEKKPDLSKLARSTEDALVTAGLIADDSRIVELRLSKAFPGEHDRALPAPGAWIYIEAVRATA